MWIPEKKYQSIIKLIPIPCVDLLVVNEEKKILLIKRKNEPAKDQWWFPGGRVNFSESRHNAAIRKLKEECGIIPKTVIELNTYDLFLPINDGSEISHAITTVYKINVDQSSVILDLQSSEYSWEGSLYWISKVENVFLKNVLGFVN